MLRYDVIYHVLCSPRFPAVGEGLLEMISHFISETSKDRLGSVVPRTWESGKVAAPGVRERAIDDRKKSWRHQRSKSRLFRQSP